MTAWCPYGKAMLLWPGEVYTIGLSLSRSLIQGRTEAPPPTYRARRPVRQVRHRLTDQRRPYFFPISRVQPPVVSLEQKLHQLISLRIKTRDYCHNSNTFVRFAVLKISVRSDLIHNPQIFTTGKGKRYAKYPGTAHGPCGSRLHMAAL